MALVAAGAVIFLLLLTLLAMALDGPPDDPGGARRRKVKALAISAGIVLLAAWGLLKVAGNEAGRADPPAACQLLGGTWDIWDGWRCA